MARPATFNKRENEKKKASKRLEKQKRKEERKTSGTNSFDDMIAYVDENGNITSTPPEERKKKEEVKAEEIEISIPKKEAVEPEILKGRIEYFNSDKGYGFVKDLASTEKYFFHVSAAPANIEQGNVVFFETERGARGINAVRIKITQ